LALKSDGSVLAWGDNSYGQTNVPLPAQNGVVAIAAGGRHNLVLKTNGSVVAWGDNLYGQVNVPAAAQSSVVAIAGGFYHSVALKADGSVVAWGLWTSGQTNVPAFAQSGVGAIAAGWQHTVALATTAQLVLLNASQTFTGINTFNNAVGISAANMLEFGAGVSPKEANAGKIGYQQFSDALDIVGAGTNGANRKIKFWAEGGATFTGNCYALSFTPTSDRNAKENFTPVTPESVLDKVISLPITEWNFKTDAGTKHLGPMAQDFYSAFGLGTDDKHIATVDADGVALAAIQGLNQKLEQKGTEITELKSRLEKLERSLNEKNGGAQ
jgi:hypothetical protein